jgi:hypothetical protein
MHFGAHGLLPFRMNNSLYIRLRLWDGAELSNKYVICRSITMI